MIPKTLVMLAASGFLILTAVGTPLLSHVGHPATGVGSCTIKGWNPATDPGATCAASSRFDWVRAFHSVSFDVPYDLEVNGVVVASGSFHFCDLPLV